MGCVIEPRKDEFAGAESCRSRSNATCAMPLCEALSSRRGRRATSRAKGLRRNLGYLVVWPSVSRERVRRSASGRRGAVADDARAREVGPGHSSWEADEQSGGDPQRSWWSEGRGQGETRQQSTHWTPSRVSVAQALARHGTEGPSTHPRQEPYAGKPHVRIWAGGC